VLTPRHVVGELSYLVPTAAKPRNYMFQPPAGTHWENCKYERKACRIYDARQTARSIALESGGFDIVQATTRVVGFDDPEVVAKDYYLEIQDLARRITGAAAAVVFDHQLRVRTRRTPPGDFGRCDGAPAAVGRVHNDYSEASGHKRLTTTLPDTAPARPFAILNFWRPVIHPALDAPLAVCDARTVAAQDLVAADVVYPTRTGEIYLAIYSPAHRWYYYPAMQPHEVLVFKTYDSRHDRRARMTPHCAFDDPTAPTDAPLRRSIEVRCLVLFD